MSLNTNDLFCEFDSQRKIVHLTARRPVHARTYEDGLALSRAVNEILAQHLSEERGYMITDLSKIIIEPRFIDIYAQHIRDLMNAYIHPHGIARYGFEITRVTVRLSQEYLEEPPNVFSTREEADEYIQGLIDRRASRSPVPSSPDC